MTRYAYRTTVRKGRLIDMLLVLAALVFLGCTFYLAVAMSVFQYKHECINPTASMKYTLEALNFDTVEGLCK